MKFQELLSEVAHEKADKKKKPVKKTEKKKGKPREPKDELAKEPGEWQGKDKSTKTEFESSMKGALKEAKKK